MMFDKLYVLTKGGRCVFDGQTPQLKCHLEQCQVECLEWQVPIEELINVSSKDTSKDALVSFLLLNYFSFTFGFTNLKN